MFLYNILIFLLISLILPQCFSAAVYIVTPENSPTSSTPKSKSSDLVFAEFKPGAGKTSERMKSVREMLDKEVIRKKIVSSTQKPQAKVEDVWEIIKHNQEQEIKHLKELTSNKKPTTTTITKPQMKIERKTNTNIETIPSISLPNQEWKVIPAGNKIVNNTSEKKRPKITSTTLATPVKKNDENIETIPSVPLSKENWNAEIPGIDRLINISGDESKPESPKNEEQPRNIKTADSWGYSYQNLNNDNSNYEYYPQTSYENNMNQQAQDRFNPAQPYLPPRPSNNKPSFKEKPSLPPPPVPMPPPPPPPPPKVVMSAPPMTYDSFPPYPPSSDDSGPPGFTSPPEDPPMMMPSDHHHHHDDYKFELPPQPSEHDHHHDHHHDPIFLSEIDHDSLQHFYHEHLHHHEMPTTTTAKPEMEESKVNNRYSYYYLGKKLWYLPLYFSVYFIVYVAVLIVKSIARHKITYPQHWKSKRSLDESWKMSPESLNALTKLVSDAVVNYGIKYLTENNSEK